MSKVPPYRPEALAARNKKAHWYGDVVLASPPTHAFAAGLALLSLVLVVCFIAFGSFARRETVVGELVPENGVTRIFSPQIGTVVTRYVADGHPVKKGEPLFRVSSEKKDPYGGAALATLSDLADRKRKNLESAVEVTEKLKAQEISASDKKVAALTMETANLAEQIRVSKERIRLDEDTVLRYEGLVAKEYIPAEQLQQKREILLDQRLSLKRLERDYLSAQRELITQQEERKNLPIKYEKQFAEINRDIDTAAQALTESEAKREVLVVAPVDGTLSSISADVGQTVGPDRQLATIVDQTSRLQVHLYAPSRAAGLIQPGNAVQIRYRAFPYQKFGQFSGKVTAVSQTALPISELTTNRGITPELVTGKEEPLYKVVVSLDQQKVKAYGREIELRSGGLAEADIVQEKRRLYEWMLAPLYTLTGRL